MRYILAIERPAVCSRLRVCLTCWCDRHVVGSNLQAVSKSCRKRNPSNWVMVVNRLRLSGLAKRWLVRLWVVCRRMSMLLRVWLASTGRAQVRALMRCPMNRSHGLLICLLVLSYLVGVRVPSPCCLCRHLNITGSIEISMTTTSISLRPL